jgi:hypothetical protein
MLKRYKLTKGNLSKVFGNNDYGVVKWIDKETIGIYATTYKNGNVVPKIYIGEKTYSPTLLTSWIENTDAIFFTKEF